MSEFHQSSPRNYLEETRQYQIYEAATIDLEKKLTRKRNYQNIQYQLLTVCFNLLAIVQVIIGATITALGPSGGDHMLAITVLGAFNTSIAGVLSLLKGRGLPQRLRRNMAEIAKVLNLIQERKTFLRYGDEQISDLGLSHILQDVFQAYNAMEQIIENNQPETYTDGSAFADVAANSGQERRGGIHKMNGKRRQIDEEMGSHDMV